MEKKISYVIHVLYFKNKHFTNQIRNDVHDILITMNITFLIWRKMRL